LKRNFRIKSIDSTLPEYQKLRQGSLTTFDLTALGIAAIVGGGIFSAIGEVASKGGPAVSILFLFTAIACAFSGLCYAVFASRIPVSGSAYTYAYASFGEFIAWVIGWDLILEYAIGNIAVAISWSDYFTAMLNNTYLQIPAYLSTDFWTAAHSSQGEAFLAWQTAPELFGIKLIADIPAFAIVFLISVLVFVGIRESKIAGNIMVLFKLIILIMVIGVGAFFVNPENWKPFNPAGIGGVLKGVGGVFFAYIGFDAITTTAEECKNPKRDLPRAMIASLVISTVLYIVIALVLTGIVHYTELAGGDPLAKVFRLINKPHFSYFIAAGAIVAMASVLLVFQVGQPRIWMAMSRDGLLPARFSKIHKKFKTPSFATVVAGILVAVPALFLNISEVTDLTSIGTLFAFILVCTGVMVLENRGELDKNRYPDAFHLPKINSRWILPIVWIGIVAFFIQKGNVSEFLSFHENELFASQIISKILTVVFILISFLISVFAIIKNLSAIPVLGLIINFFLMTELTPATWVRFLIWLTIGLIIYFTYGRKHSLFNLKLHDGNKQKN